MKAAATLTGLLLCAAASAADREIILTRDFDAPPELVFQAWTDPRHLQRWWGPDGFTITMHACEVRVGGACRRGGW